MAEKAERTKVLKKMANDKLLQKAQQTPSTGAKAMVSVTPRLMLGL